MIQLLSPEVRDQIAAGEVVERPAHLVKELIENSLDAGATKIKVVVADNCRSIQVTDNGSGIPESELGLALERFATSKIKKTEDLFKLYSFGFRGEALASASAVSKLTLISKTEKQNSAYQIQSSFSEKKAVQAVSHETGTSLFISQLFENVPARLKFLKSESAENQAVKNVIKAFALSHPNCEFRYFENEKLVSVYEADLDWKTRCQKVLELESPLFETSFESEGWKLRMAFSSPENVARTSRQIWIFVQGRTVLDRALQTAILDSYRSLLMHGEYPYVVLDLRLPTDQVDVNIHPTKSQVKFLNPSQAFRTVHHALRSALEKAPWNLQNSFQSYEPLKLSSPVFQDHQQVSWSTGGYQFQKKSTPTLNEWQSAAIQREVPTGGYWSSLEVIGQLGLTYIITQSGEGLMLVDQHAAHERVAFEKLMKAYQSSDISTQNFLFPLALDLTSAQAQALMTHKIHFQKMGIDIEELGPNTLGVTSAPLIMKESSLPMLFSQMADDILELGSSFVFEKKLIDICATFACHSVVRAGQALSHGEMKSLLEQMDEFPLSSFCPHGRPVSIKWSFAELEKEFGRRN